ncbi:hypothetical protein [Kitasatospora cineracea]|uniref:Uncharacterized protein n=1 Tax=Kitasatospora cineracea TaxID=88074 RepID=A0A3N4R3Z3_9ACTN|nr:hypothetical protein [Kitasatospora cineracea]RPE27316.1 hypothetical protein EDD38_7461 [Kitasatospora cineracea]
MPDWNFNAGYGVEPQRVEPPVIPGQPDPHAAPQGTSQDSAQQGGGQGE